jgi:hypothetical protein
VRLLAISRVIRFPSRSSFDKLKGHLCEDGYPLLDERAPILPLNVELKTGIGFCQQRACRMMRQSFFGMIP